MIFELLRQKCQKFSFGPETYEIGPKVLQKVYGKFTESSKTCPEDPQGPIRAHIGFSGPIWTTTLAWGLGNLWCGVGANLFCVCCVFVFGGGAAKGRT